MVEGFKGKPKERPCVVLRVAFLAWVKGKPKRKTAQRHFVLNTCAKFNGGPELEEFPLHMMAFQVPFKFAGRTTTVSHVDPAFLNLLD